MSAKRHIRDAAGSSPAERDVLYAKHQAVLETCRNGPQRMVTLAEGVEVSVPNLALLVPRYNGTPTIETTQISPSKVIIMQTGVYDLRRNAEKYCRNNGMNYHIVYGWHDRIERSIRPQCLIVFQNVGDQMIVKTMFPELR